MTTTPSCNFLWRCLSPKSHFAPVDDAAVLVVVVACLVVYHRHDDVVVVVVDHPLRHASLVVVVDPFVQIAVVVRDGDVAVARVDVSDAAVCPSPNPFLGFLERAALLAVAVDVVANSLVVRVVVAEAA